MKVKQIVEEDFVNYKEPSLFIGTCFCDFKCCTESGLDIEVCQNAPLVQTDIKDIPDDVIYDSFIKNNITKAVVIGGMEPFLQFDEIHSLINLFRKNGCDSDFVIYTGYYPNEIEEQLKVLSRYKNIIIKFGRYIPNRAPVFDNVLGVNLASNNQYAGRIS